MPSSGVNKNSFKGRKNCSQDANTSENTSFNNVEEIISLILIFKNIIIHKFIDNIFYIAIDTWLCPKKTADAEGGTKLSKPIQD